MTHNKDKGTSVGFSKPFDGRDTWEHTDIENNKVCKEHEWVEEKMDDYRFKWCTKCYNHVPIGKEKPIDFKISENLEIINKNEWEDIENEFEKSLVYKNADYDHTIRFDELFKWLKENYLAPEQKKNT